MSRHKMYAHTDHMGDTLEVVADYSLQVGPVVEFTTERCPWLTPTESKRLRKALKRWEKSVTPEAEA